MDLSATHQSPLVILLTLGELALEIGDNHVPLGDNASLVVLRGSRSLSRPVVVRPTRKESLNTDDGLKAEQ